MNKLTPPRESCDSCRFCRLAIGPTKDAAKVCAIAPPQVTLVPTNQGPVPVTYMPQVPVTNWCGKWEPEPPVLVS